MTYRYYYIFAYALLYCGSSLVEAQSIGDFVSIAPGPQSEKFVIPNSHQFQKIFEHGETSNGVTVRDQLDFTGYVPIGGSSVNGYLSVNSEAEPGGVMVGDVQLDGSSGLWSLSNLTDIDFSGVAGTNWNCSGAVTSWGNVISCEERILFDDDNNDGYNDNGWAVEIDPATKMVVAKHYAMGNFKHENAAIDANQRTVYQGVDDATGYLYKFVATTAADLSAGALYVYKGPKAGNTGEWILLQNGTPAQCNSTLSQSATEGATVFDGIEDVEIGPDGWVYFAVKNEDRVYRFQDPTLLTGGGTITMETFVGGTGVTYDIVHDGGTTTETWGNGCDNLAFDGDGNLWVLQDGDRHYIWVVGSDHTPAAPKVKIFGQAPHGAEPTGITFTPDYKYLFMSIQHPNATNNANQTDMAGTEIDFDADISLVISRVPGGFPIELSEFTATAAAGPSVVLAWTTATETNNDYFSVERSPDGEKFTPIHTLPGAGTSRIARNYRYVDERVVSGRTYYYRLQQVDFDGSFSYSPVQSVRVGSDARLSDLRIVPNPPRPQQTRVYFSAEYSGSIRAQLVDSQGKVAWSRDWEVRKGRNEQPLRLSALPTGTYLLRLSDERGTTLVQKLVKGE